MAWTTSADPARCFAQDASGTDPSGPWARPRRADKAALLRTVPPVAALLHLAVLSELAFGLTGLARTHAASPSALAGLAVVSGLGLLLGLVWLSGSATRTHRELPIDRPAVAAAAPVSPVNQPPDFQVRSRADADSDPCWVALMAQVSHEIRTPLNAVLGFSDLMQQELYGPLGDPRYREYLEHIRSGGSALLRAAEDTLAMTSLAAGPAAGRGDRVALRTLADEVRETLGEEIRRRHITLQLAIEDDLEVEADRRGLRQAIVNLLTAAIRTSAPHGCVTIRARGADGFVDLACLVDRLADASTAPVVRESRAPGQGSAELYLLLARALLNLQGCSLAENRAGAAGWRMSTRLVRAAQQELALA